LAARRFETSLDLDGRLFVFLVHCHSGLLQRGDVRPQISGSSARNLAT